MYSVLSIMILLCYCCKDVASSNNIYYKFYLAEYSVHELSLVWCFGHQQPQPYFVDSSDHQTKVGQFETSQRLG